MCLWINVDKDACDYSCSSSDQRKVTVRNASPCPKLEWNVRKMSPGNSSHSKCWAKMYATPSLYCDRKSSNCSWDYRAFRLRHEYRGAYHRRYCRCDRRASETVSYCNQLAQWAEHRRSPMPGSHRRAEMAALRCSEALNGIDHHDWMVCVRILYHLSQPTHRSSYPGVRWSVQLPPVSYGSMEPSASSHDSIVRLAINAGHVDNPLRWIV